MSSEVKASVIHVDFKAEKRRKTPENPAPKEDRFIRHETKVSPIRATDSFHFRDRMMDISGWWIRLGVFVTLVSLGLLAFGA